jgi:hypothetical protein
MFTSTIFPTTSSGGANPGDFALVEKVLTHQSTGADHIIITESGLIERDAIIASLQADFLGPDDALHFVPERVLVRRVLCGGGAGGASGSSECFGGFGGVVLFDEFPLSEMPDSLSCVIGAGGDTDTSGGATEIGLYEGEEQYHRSTGQAFSGGHSGGIQDEFTNAMVGLNGFPLPSMTKNNFLTLTIMANNSPYGPGGGGGVRDNSEGTGNNFGGGGSQLCGLAKTAAVFPGNPGTDANPLLFRAFGGGGSGVTSGNNELGFIGGFPGGGGGASDTEGYGGLGGNGCVKLQFLLRYLANV